MKLKKYFPSTIWNRVLVLLVGVGCTIFGSQARKADYYKHLSSQSDLNDQLELKDILKNQESRKKIIKNCLKYCLNGKNVIPSQDIINLCKSVRKVFKKEDRLLKVNGKTIVVGDIHSDILSIEFIFRKFLENAEEGQHIIFLGDYVDHGEKAYNGSNGVKVVFLLFLLKKLYPDQVHIIRGNHEDSNLNRNGEFYKECNKVYGYNNDVFTSFNRVFNTLPLAAILNDGKRNVFCVHGGPDIDLDSLDDIDDISHDLDLDRLATHKGKLNYQEQFELNTAYNLMWTDIKSGRNSKNRKGKFLKTDDVKTFMYENNIDCIVRGHDTRDGHESIALDHSKKYWITTLFSAPNYSPKYHSGKNKGDIMYCHNGKVRFESIKYNSRFLKSSH